MQGGVWQACLCILCIGPFTFARAPSHLPTVLPQIRPAFEDSHTCHVFRGGCAIHSFIHSPSLPHSHPFLPSSCILLPHASSPPASSLSFPHAQRVIPNLPGLPGRPCHCNSSCRSSRLSVLCILSCLSRRGYYGIYDLS
jgi:hypothetical protein